MPTPPDFVTGQVLTAAQMNTIALHKVGNAAAVYGTTTQLNMNGLFTADYFNYKVVVSNLRMSAANSTLSLQLLKAGTPATGANYDFAYRGLGADGTNRDTNNFNQTSLADLGCFNSTANNYRQQVSFEVITPAVSTTPTSFLNISACGFAAYLFTRNGAAQHNVTDSYDGLRFFPSAGGTFEAQVVVYGFRK